MLPSEQNPNAVAAAPAHDADRWQYPIAFLLFTVFLAVYWLTPTACYTFDAVSYANQIVLFRHTRHLHWLFHPHHLLFNATGYVAWEADRGLFGYHGGPLPVVQRMNAVLGAAGVALLWLTFRQTLACGRALAVVLAAGVGLSFGYWICATDARVNMPSLVLLIGAFFTLARAVQRPTALRVGTAGAVAGLAALYHESAGLFLVVGCVGVALAQFTQDADNERRRARRVAVGGYAMAWGLVFVISYALVGTVVLHLTTLAAYRQWATEYAELGWWWSMDVAGNLPKDVYGIRRALFVEPAGPAVTLAGAPIGWALYDLAYAGWLGMLGFCAIAIVLLRKSADRLYLIAALVWIAAYAAFFTFWNPDYFVFWVPVILAGAAILAVCARHYTVDRRQSLWIALLGIWVLCYGISNDLQGIRPAERVSRNHSLLQALDLRAHTRPGDMVVLSGVPWQADAEVYVPYFGKRDVFSVHTQMERHREDTQDTIGDLQAKIDSTYAAGHAVYALDDLWHSPMARQILAERHHLTDADLARFFTDDVRTLAWTDPEGQPVWKLTPAAGTHDANAHPAVVKH